MVAGARLRVGVLALQGDVREHMRSLEAAGAAACEVRSAAALDDVDGLVIPGGESTTVGRLLERFDMTEALRARIDAGMPVYGTCTGLILLARRVDEGVEGQPLLGRLDVRVQRNGYGRQLDSFEADVTVEAGELAQKPFRAVFIRAPRIVAHGPAVEVLGRHDGVAVAVRQGHILATSFHPELTDDVRLHAFFTKMCQARGVTTT